MSQSLSNVLLHVAWSTKDGEPWIADCITERFHSYVVGEYHRGNRRLSFQVEFRAFLKKSDVAFDERYLWD